MSEDAKLAELIDEREIMKTLHRYGQAMDYGLEDEFVAVFTDDGVFDVHLPDGTGGHREVGRAELAAYIAKYPKPPAAYNKHIIIDPIVEIDGDRAHVVSYWMALKRDADGHPAIGSYGRYLDDLVKVGGAWRIAERVAELEAF